MTVELEVHKKEFSSRAPGKSHAPHIVRRTGTQTCLGGGLLPSPNETGGRGALLSISTIFGGDFEEISLVFCWMEDRRCDPPKFRWQITCRARIGSCQGWAFPKSVMG